MDKDCICEIDRVSNAFILLFYVISLMCPDFNRIHIVEHKIEFKFYLVGVIFLLLKDTSLINHTLGQCPSNNKYRCT